MADFIRAGRLGFLPLWLRRANLQTLLRRSLRGKPEALDRFVRLDEKDSIAVRAQPRGLAVHWVAGNVPVLGMLSVVQSMLCKNANLGKGLAAVAGRPAAFARGASRGGRIPILRTRRFQGGF